MVAQEFKQDMVHRDIMLAQDWTARALKDVIRADRVDALDSIKIAMERLEVAKLRLTASLAADLLKEHGWKDESGG